MVLSVTMLISTITILYDYIVIHRAQLKVHTDRLQVLYVALCRDITNVKDL